MICAAVDMVIEPPRSVANIAVLKSHFVCEIIARAIITTDSVVILCERVSLRYSPDSPAFFSSDTTSLPSLFFFLAQGNQQSPL